MSEPVDFRMEDVLLLRKPHPCGSYEWRVVRLGADIRIECLSCRRRVMLPRRDLERRTRRIVTRGPEMPELPVATESG